MLGASSTSCQAAAVENFPGGHILCDKEKRRIALTAPSPAEVQQPWERRLNIFPALLKQRVVSNKSSFIQYRKA